MMESPRDAETPGWRVSGVMESLRGAAPSVEAPRSGERSVPRISPSGKDREPQNWTPLGVLSPWDAEPGISRVSLARPTGALRAGIRSGLVSPLGAALGVLPFLGYPVSPSISSSPCLDSAPHLVPGGRGAVLPSDWLQDHPVPGVTERVSHAQSRLKNGPSTCGVLGL